MKRISVLLESGPRQATGGASYHSSDKQQRRHCHSRHGEMGDAFDFFAHGQGYNQIKAYILSTGLSTSIDKFKLDCIRWQRYMLLLCNRSTIACTTYICLQRAFLLRMCS